MLHIFFDQFCTLHLVIPAQAGNQGNKKYPIVTLWIPACAGMTLDNANSYWNRVTARTLHTEVQHFYPMA